MSSVLATLVSYVPAITLERLASRPDPLRAPLAEHRRGALLLADIADFTRLTRQHEGHRAAGAESLGRALNGVFSEMIDLVHAQGGDVLTFVGDAMLAFWPADGEDLTLQTERAATCALSMQAALQHRRDLAHHAISLRIGLVAGPITLLHVGGLGDRWEMLVAGTCLTDLSRAKLAAAPGGVVTTAATWPAIADRFIGAATADGHVQVIASTRALRWQRREEPPCHADMQRALHQYLPLSVRERLSAGQTDWLADSRQVTALFVTLPDLVAHASLDEAQTVMTLLQTALARFEGSIKELSTDDHGVVLVAAFGLPPLSHADDASRSVQAAMAISEALREAGMRHAIGIASGQAFCGIIGNDRRRQFAIFGDVMVRAARLMQMAPQTIWCDQATYTAAEATIRFTACDPVTLKGMDQAIPVFRPEAVHVGQAEPVGPMLGRDAELQGLVRRLNDLVAGRHGSLTLIEGEAGIGKSLLLAALRQAAAARTVSWLGSVADPFAQDQPYGTWKSVVAGLFDWDTAPADADGQAHHLRSRLAEVGVDPDLLPLLGELLPLTLAETATTAALTGTRRAERLHDLVIRRLQEVSRRRPTLIALDDAQWGDPASWALTAAISRAVPSIMLVVAAQPPTDSGSGDYRQFLGHPRLQRLPLGRLDRDAIAAAVAQRLGVDSLAPALALRLQDRAEGHPLFSLEIAAAMRDQGLITDSGGIAHPAGTEGRLPGLPTTVAGVVTSRIDRLTPSQQLVLKAASVIGRTFLASQVRDIFPVVERQGRIDEHLETLCRQDLLASEPGDGEPRYRFKHAILQEAIDGLMLGEQRQQLHRAIALWYEHHQPDDLGTLHAVLAGHWTQDADPQRALGYLVKGGKQALRAGAPFEAVRLLREAVTAIGQQPDVTPTLDRATLEALLGQAYLGAGQLPEAKLHLEHSLALSGNPLPRHRAGIAVAVARQLVRQLRHRWRSPEPAGVDREALLATTRTYGLLAETAYFQGDRPLLALTILTALNLAEKAGPSPELAQAYAALSLPCGMASLHRLAAHYARRAERLIPACPADAMPMTAVALIASNRLGPGAIIQLERILTDYDRLGNHKERGYALYLLSHAYQDQGNFRRSIGTLERLHAQASSHNDVQQQAWALTGLAVCHLRLGDGATAARLAEDAVPLYVSSGDLVHGRSNQALQALIASAQGDTDMARRLADDVLAQLAAEPPRLTNAYGSYRYVTEAALAIWEAGEPTKATSRFTDAQRARLACRLLVRFARTRPAASAAALTLLGVCRWLDGKQAKARQAWQRGLDVALKSQQPADEARANLEIARHLPDHDPAKRAHFERGRELCQQMGIWEAMQGRHRPADRRGSGPLRPA
jgi:class 3 adenylate cyclase/tetratricopeptide (TPR) repeat protein